MKYVLIAGPREQVRQAINLFIQLDIKFHYEPSIAINVDRVITGKIKDDVTVDFSQFSSINVVEHSKSNAGVFNA